MEEGSRSLNVLDKHVANNRFFAGDRYTIADVALYSYTHLAEQSEFDLKPFPALRDWLARVAAEPRHVAMDYRREALEVAAE
jgi:glutathione S-transferase